MSPRQPDRQVYSRGPIIRLLEYANLLTAIIAVGALVFALVAFSSQVDTLVQRQQDIQRSRVESATDTCRRLRTVIVQAYKPQSQRVTYHAVLFEGRHHRRVRLQFAPMAKGLAARVVKADGLTDCEAAARAQTRVPSPR